MCWHTQCGLVSFAVLSHCTYTYNIIYNSEIIVSTGGTLDLHAVQTSGVKKTIDLHGKTVEQAEKMVQDELDSFVKGIVAGL